MKKIVAIIMIGFISFNVVAQDEFVALKKISTEKKTNSFSKYMDGMNQLVDFNGGIKIYQKGVLKFDYYKGLESKDTGKKVSETSRFPIASLTKPFTAMMILKLVEEGKIDLEKTISDYLPYYRKDIGSKIKIIDLINNRSGLPEYASRYDEVSISNLNIKDFIVEFCSDNPHFEPGSQFEYSNTGFYILGAIIETVTGKSFKQVIESEILMRADMKNSGVFERKRAYEYNLIDGHENMNKSKPFNPITVYAAGNIYSTTQDMVKWYKAMMNYKLLSKKTIDELFSGKPIQYYKGWSYKNIYGQLGFGHTGGITGFNTQMITIPEQDIFIVILANNSTLPLEKIGKDLAAIAIGKDVIVPSKKLNIKVPPMILNKFVGSYQHQSGNKLQIGIENGELFLLLFGSKKPLMAETMTKFYMDQFGPTIELSFEGGLTWSQDGNKFNYDRMNSDSPNINHKKTTLSESEIKLIVGKYYKDNSFIEISWKSGKFIFKKDSEKEKDLIQKSEMLFYYEANENGYQFKYPVKFQVEKNLIIYDGDIIYSKGK